MKILERNYQNSMQSYLVHDNEAEAKEVLRGNLLSRLSSFISKDLNEDEIKESIIPNVRVRVIRVHTISGKDKPLFIGGLSLPNIKFTPSSEPISDSIDKEFKNSGVDLPTKDILDNRLEKMYSSNKVISDTFNLTNIKVKVISDRIPVTETEYSNIDKFSDRMYSEEPHTNHFRMLRAVSLMALHKHVTENPSSPKDRLLKGIDALTKELTDQREKDDLKNYLLNYVNNPSSRSLLVKEAELVIKSRSEQPGINIPTWVVASVIGVILLGGIIYNQRENLATAWNFTKEVSKKQPEVSKKKSFFKALFSREGKSIAKDYLNDKNVNSRNKQFLNEVHILTKESEAKVLRTDYNMELLMKKFLRK